MNIFCLGLSHQTANVSIRERFAVPDSMLADALRQLKRVPGVDEAVILSTCNRTEFYLAGQPVRPTPETVFSGLRRQVLKGDFEHLFELTAVEAARHLFRVTSGLESMVVGETEIFGQVKRAYQAAAKLGVTGKYLNRLFQKSFQVGKHVRANTGITRGSVSIGSVAVDLAMQIFGNLEGCKIMILGAGETSERTARAFHSRGARQIFVSNRSFDRAQTLAASVSASAIRFDDWEQEFVDVDILVSSTSAPHALMTVAKLEPIMRRRRERPLFIIDLAMPRDVEPAVHAIDGVYLYDLDSLEVMAAKGLDARRREADLGEQLVLQHVREFDEWLGRAASSFPGLAPGVMFEGCPRLL
ncbi:MAG: glutamyl-tRNA reductase [Verrucomicrobia bacterium]|nr:glutamyl-tRNA reductase [Verrucomicrobiota bacterium]